VTLSTTPQMQSFPKGSKSLLVKSLILYINLCGFFYVTLK